MEVLTKVVYTILTIMTIIVVIPGFVTVMGFLAAGIGHWCFGYSIEQMQIIVDIVNSVWRLYGIIQ